eukprot:TRINITY_DN7269_c0_g1_i1.p1 TRINITY_DN7269_c0_g1~~TRINITY_DN7269_c0_g1_i1.p1  ORF type:complete len:250 (+),score=32.99 TRINITY_DN7269_c0_g1_i1:157-906(+)
MASPVTKVTFFYDFISPYSYLAFRQLKRLRTKYGAQRLQVSYKPVVFGALLTHWSNKGPAEIPPKREFVFRDVHRYAKANNEPFSVPRAHPFLPLFPLRLTLLSTCNNDFSLQEHLIDAIYSSLWGDASGYGINPTEAEFTRVAAAAIPPQPSALTIDQLVIRAKSDVAKQELKTNGEEAAKLGVFGVPTMIVYPPTPNKAPELFWGNDQLNYIEMIINGKGGVIEVSPEYEQALRSIPAASVRPQSKL